MTEKFSARARLKNIMKSDHREYRNQTLSDAGIDFVPTDARHVRILIKDPGPSQKESIYWTLGDAPNIDIHVERITFRQFEKMKNSRIKIREV
jgi:hypothetical protein